MTVNALPSFSLRPMQPSDLDAVMTIEVAACPTPWSRKGYQNELQHNDKAHYTVLELETVGMVGYVGHWIMLDECHISIIAVHPDWQGNGFGEVLLLTALQDALKQGAQIGTLEVREHNHVAQSLYRKLGFAVVGRRKNYYKDSKEDALIMTDSALDTAALAAFWQTRTHALRQSVSTTV